MIPCSSIRADMSTLLDAPTYIQWHNIIRIHRRQTWSAPINYRTSFISWYGLPNQIYLFADVMNRPIESGSEGPVLLGVRPLRPSQWDGCKFESETATSQLWRDDAGPSPFIIPLCRRLGYGCVSHLLPSSRQTSLWFIQACWSCRNNQWCCLCHSVCCY